MARREALGNIRFWIAIGFFILFQSCKTGNKSAQTVEIHDTVQIVKHDTIVEYVSPPLKSHDSVIHDSAQVKGVDHFLNSSFIPLAMRVVRALSESDLGTVDGAIHPDIDLVISPYSFIDSPQVWKALTPALAFPDSIYHWGYYDGSGESIRMTFDEYYSSFIYCANFLAVLDTAVNHPAHFGNSLNNFSELFPEAEFLDFHSEGKEEYGYLDWKILRLGFQFIDNRWYLVAIIHDEWTI